jgi:hypothetical protein
MIAAAATATATAAAAATATATADFSLVVIAAEFNHLSLDNFNNRYKGDSVVLPTSSAMKLATGFAMKEARQSQLVLQQGKQGGANKSRSKVTDWLEGSRARSK